LAQKNYIGCGDLVIFVGELLGGEQDLGGAKIDAPLNDHR